MKEHSWDIARRMVGSRPLVEAQIPGAAPLHAVRYRLNKVEPVPPLPEMTLALILGGHRLIEGQLTKRLTQLAPGTAVLIPAGCATDWQLSGVIDCGLFYFTDLEVLLAVRLLQSAVEPQPYPFVDSLVVATAWQILNELERGTLADMHLVQRLSEMMLEQTCRVLEGLFGRLLTPTAPESESGIQGVLTWLGEHYAQRITLATLAKRAGMSDSHFRRVFTQQVGCPPHRYLSRIRLERVRELLLQTRLPLARIAEDCGFESQSHMTASFRVAYGMPPAKFRRVVMAASTHV